jgi:hypothetical protein
VRGLLMMAFVLAVVGPVAGPKLYSVAAGSIHAAHQAQQLLNCDARAAGQSTAAGPGPGEAHCQQLDRQLASTLGTNFQTGATAPGALITSTP